MERATSQQEWKRAWADYEQAHKAWDAAMPSTQSSMPIQFESIDMDRLDQLKAEMDRAWSRIVTLDQNRPAT